MLLKQKIYMDFGLGPGNGAIPQLTKNIFGPIPHTLFGPIPQHFFGPSRVPRMGNLKAQIIKKTVHRQNGYL